MTPASEIPNMRRAGELLSLSAQAIRAAPGSALRTTRSHWVSGGFLRQVTVLASGSMVAQLLSLAAAPILSRAYSPSAFGVLGLFVSTAAILGVVAGLRYDLAVVLPESDDDAANLLALAILSTTGLTAITVAAVTLAGGWFAIVLGAPELIPLLRWLPASVCAIGLYQALTYWSTRRKHFGRLSIARIGQSGTMNAIQIGGGLLGGASRFLVGGQVVGQVVAACTLGYQVWRDDGARLRSAVVLPRLRRVGYEFRQFPFFSTPQALLNGVSQNLPLILLAALFDPSVAGLYLLAQRLLQVPIGLIGGSVRQVFLQRASEQYTRGRDTRQLHVRFTAGLAAIALMPTALVVAWGPDLFSFVLGSEWTTAGEYARWLILWLFMLFINSPSVVLAEVFRCQKELLVYDALLLMTRSGALLVGAVAGSAFVAIASYSLVGAAFNGGLILWVWRLTGTERGGQECPV